MTGIDAWRGRRVLVTGATGLVGSAVCRTLVDEGADVTALVRDHDPHAELLRSGTHDEISVVSGSLEAPGVVERAINEHESQVVLHLGAQTIVGAALRSPVETFEANIRGTWQVLEAARRLPGIVEAVVVASSDKAYGAQPALPYVETMPLEGRAPYEVSKSCADLITTSYHQSYGVPTGIARCGNVYGGGDLNWSRLVPGTIRSLLRGERPVLRSDGTFVRDYLYVGDVVDAYLTLATAVAAGDSVGEAFNFSDERPLTVREMYAAIGAAVGEDVEPVVLDDAPGEIHDQYLDAGKAQRVLGWKPRWGLTDGLAETVRWYRSHLGVPAP